MAGNTTTYEVGAINDNNAGNRGNVLWVRDARYSQTGRQFSYTYDNYGRKTSETNLNNVETTFTYGDQWGNLTETVQDPNGLARATSMVYDAAGKVTSKTDPMGYTASIEYNNAGQPTEINFPNPNSETISYTYGDNGRTATVTDGRGITTISYESGSNRMHSVNDPVTGAVTYTYRLHGEPLTTTYPDGTVVTKTYPTFINPLIGNMVISDESSIDKIMLAPESMTMSRNGLPDEKIATHLEVWGSAEWVECNMKYNNGDRVGYMRTDNTFE